MLKNGLTKRILSSALVAALLFNTVLSDSSLAFADPAPAEEQTALAEDTGNPDATEENGAPEENNDDTGAPSEEAAPTQEVTEAPEEAPAEEAADPAATVTPAAETNPAESIDVAVEETATPTPTPTEELVDLAAVENAFSINGYIDYDEGTQDSKSQIIDWGEILRPDVFDGTITVTATLEDGSTRDITLQDNISSDAFYLKFVFNGEGGNDEWQIDNVPRAIDGVNVVNYHIGITNKAEHPYYTCQGIDVTDIQEDIPTGCSDRGLTQELITESLTVRPQIEPDGATTDEAVVKLVFKNTPNETEKAMDTISESLAYGDSYTIAVPVGVKYEVSMNGSEGYKYLSYTDSKNRTAEGEAAGVPIINPTTSTNPIALGTVDRYYAEDISMLNVYQNYNYQFDVHWIDSKGKERPTPEFKLMFAYVDEYGAVSEYLVVNENLSTLGLDAEPTVRKVNGMSYSFDHLPLASADGRKVTYSVIEEENLEGYIIKEDFAAYGRTQHIDNIESETFSASIVWYDTENVWDTRPTTDAEMQTYLSKLHLLGETGKETDPSERVSPELQWSKESDGVWVGTDNAGHTIRVNATGNSWAVTSDALPRFTEEGNELFYFLNQDDIDSYDTLYTNTSSEQNHVSPGAFNGGEVVNVLDDDYTFHATKVWKDPDDSDRPTANVTLWRYSVKAGETDTGADANFADNAARVVFNLPDKGDVILSYDLDGTTDTEDIAFTASKLGVTNWTEYPELFNAETGDALLPAYDEDGNKYVYFVRETLGSDGDTYQTTYDSGQQQGAYHEGTITNTRVKKIAVEVDKIWKAPALLKQISERSVTTAVYAKSTRDGQYYKLNVISDKAGDFSVLPDDKAKQESTIVGFDQNTGTNFTSYYVNAFDDEGYPFDMSTAFIAELEVKDAAETVIPDVDLENQLNTFEIGEATYKGQTTNIEESTVLVNGETLDGYIYDVTNTIYAPKIYDIYKTWGSNVDHDDVTYVVFKLIGTSESGERIEIPNLKMDTSWHIHIDENVTLVDSSGNEMILPKYDSEGYLINYKAYEIGYMTAETGDQVLSYTSRWGAHHTYTEDSTTVANVKGEGDPPYLYISKEWHDGGDTSHRPDSIIVHAMSEDMTIDYSSDEMKNDPLYVAPIVLTQHNQWYVERRLPEDAANYIFVEYSAKAKVDGVDKEYLAVNGEPAAYTDAKGRSGYKVTGDIQTEDRMYRIIDINVYTGNDAIVSLENTRYGYFDLEFVKNWVDGNNFSGDRPEELKFQLYRNDVALNPAEDLTAEQRAAYPNIDENGILTIKVDDVTISDTEIGADDDSLIGQVAGAVAEATGKRSAQAWDYSVLKLDKYDADGEVILYTAKELNSETLATLDYESKYLGFETSAVAGEPDHGKIKYEYLNSKTGYTDFEFYKKWNDLSRTTTDARPDLYMTIYRYVAVDESDPDYENKLAEAIENAEVFISYSDQKWVANEGGQTAPDGTVYDWYISIGEELPKYNEDGYPYVYYARELMNNNGESAYGRYKKIYPSETVTNYGYIADTETINNSLTGKITVKGLKVWQNIEEEYPDAELPSPTLTLHRYLRSEVKDGKTREDVWTDIDSLVLDTDKYHFNFPTESCTYAEDGKLERYAETGERYIYVVTEDMDDQTSITEQGRINVKELYTVAENNGTLVNTFDVDKNKRKIEVTKTWDRSLVDEENEDVYPTVNFNIYRYELGDKDPATVSVADKKANGILETVTITAKEFKASGGEVSVAVDGLLIYAPNGVKYGYYIEERGYDKTNKIQGYDTSYDVDETGSADTEGINVGNDISLDATEDEKTSHSEVTNEYNQYNNLTIKGNKYWNDYGSDPIFNARPSEITLKLYRSAVTESRQNNAIKEHEITLKTKTAVDPAETEPYIVWDKSTDNQNYWSYKIYNLEKIAPNGRYYTYKIKETEVDGYKNSKNNTVSKSSSAATADGDKWILDMGSTSSTGIKNSLNGKYSVRKDWQDGGNKYNLRPASVTFVLERSTDGTNWSKIPATDATQAGGLPADYTDADGNTWVAKKVTAQYVLANTDNRSWLYTFENLPVQYKAADGTFKDYSYRCTEVKIGEALVNLDTGVAGSYTAEYRSITSSRTTVWNTLTNTSLAVEKVWSGDNENLYKVRPSKITLYLQMQKAASKDAVTEDGWTDVLKADGKPYTFELTAANKWKAELKDMPVCSNDDNVQPLFYRAVEKHTDDKRTDGTLIPAEAKNYKDVTVYGSAWKYTEATEGSDPKNEMTITNALIYHETKKITVQKKWQNRNNDTAAADAVFELKYSTNGGKTWNSYTKDTTNKIQTIPKNDPNKVISWDDLPAKTAAGTAITYKVFETSISGYTYEWKEISKQEIGTSVVGDKVYVSNQQFTNIELQNYTVQKTWINESYAAKEGTNFTASYQLQRKDGEGAEWKAVSGAAEGIVSVGTANTSASYTWNKLPMYSADGTEYSYRAVETKINGKALTIDTDGDGINDSNGDYIATWGQANPRGTSSTDPDFDIVQTNYENRMIVGYVNLKKIAAYNDTSAKEIVNDTTSLAGAEFSLYKDGATTAYVTGVKTDANGNLINTDGKYGKEQKYLVAGTYKLVETKAPAGYSTWKNSVTFTVGVADPGTSDTGEHGTAWIYNMNTADAKTSALTLGVKYLTAKTDAEGKVIKEAQTDTATVAADVESRGTMTFSKKGKDANTNISNHLAATNDTRVYFGVYDKATGKQVAGMKGTDADPYTMILCNEDKDGNAIDAMSGNIPYLRADTSGAYYLLSGNYVIKEEKAPAGYELSTKTINVTVPEIQSSKAEDYAANIAKVDNGSTLLNKQYSWLNTPNEVKVYKLDQFGQNVTLKNNGHLILEATDGSTLMTGQTQIYLYQNASKPWTNPDGSTSAPNGAPQITYSATDHSWTLTAFLDAGKEYKISEPLASVPADNLQMSPYTFKVDTAGKMTATSADAVKQTNVKTADGDDYANYYNDTDVALRDIRRYYTDLTLTKKDSDTDEPIANISFKLYTYTGDAPSVNEDGTSNDTSVLPDGVVLTTDANGKIELKSYEVNGKVVTNMITNSSMANGLTIGKYYFLEQESGASDKYRLLDPVTFEIKAAGGQAAPGAKLG